MQYDVIRLQDGVMGVSLLGWLCGVSSYDPWEAEEVEVAALLTPRTIKLTSSLKHDHVSQVKKIAGRIVDMRVQASARGETMRQPHTPVLHAGV